MKHQLLLMSTMLMTGTATFAQNKSNMPVEKPLPVVRTNNKTDAIPYFPETNFKPFTNNANKVQAPPYRKISASHNGYTVLVSDYNCLTYNKALNTVMFTHRKSPDWAFTTPAGANSGSIQSTWSSNNGQSWDSTITWVDATNLARYPSGAIYNPQGNTNPANAKVVAMGSVTSSTTWLGSYFTHGPLTPGAITTSNMLFVPFNGSNTTNGNSIGGAMAETRIDLQEINGTIWGAGKIYNDYNGSGGAAQNYRGVAIIKATTTDGGATFQWKCDSLFPSFTMNPGGYPEMGTIKLAFSPNGQIGYLVVTGVPAGATGVNKSYVPVVYKTTNAGANWTPVNTNYDWSTHTCLMNSLRPTSYDATPETRPSFSFLFGGDAVVDNQGRLHFVCVGGSAYSSHLDSLDYTRGYSYAGAKNYPYIFDFVTDGTGTWTDYFVDSLTTSRLTDNTENQWFEGSASTKTWNDNRIQVSRTTDGSRIFVGWTDSDQSFTGHIYNTIPNIFVRAINANNMAMSDRKNMNNDQQDAYWMYMSNIVAEPAAGQYRIPFTYSLSRGATFDFLLTMDHYYIDDAIITDAEINRPYFGCAYTGINESRGAIESVSQNFPNPFDIQTSIKVSLTTAEDIQFSLYNVMGQQVNNRTVKGNSGTNTINVDAAALSSGVYFYSVKVNEHVITKKMTIQK